MYYEFCSEKDYAATVISSLARDLLFDIGAFAENLFHNDFEGFAQKELPLRVLDERLSEVTEFGWWLVLPIHCD